MNPVHKLAVRIRALVQKRKIDAEMDQEMRAHIEMRTQQNIDLGMSPEQARYAALRQFGWTESIKEVCREQRTGAWFQTVLQDIRYGARILRRSPGFTAVAVLTLAVGIGVNTGIFSLINAVMLRRLPVSDPSRLVLFGDGESAGSTAGLPNGSWTLFSYPMFREFEQRNTVFSGVAAIKSLLLSVHAKVSGSTELEKVQTQLVSGSYFPVLGVNAHLGRLFTEADDRTPGGHPVAVLSYAWWNRRFARDQSIVGKAVTIGSTVYTIIGVAPPEFFGISVGQSPDLWIPLAMEAEVSPGWTGLNDKFFQSLHVLGRLKPNLDIQKAGADVNVLFKQMLNDYVGPAPTKQQQQDIQLARIDLTPAATGLSNLRSQFSAPLRTLMALVGLVLFIACSNVANLLLARATKRHQEIAVRMAVGAGRARLIRQLLTESMLLAILGGTLGILLAWWASHLLLAMVSTGPELLPLQVSPDERVLAFTVGASAVAALVFGTAQAFRATLVGISDALKDGRNMTSGRARTPLVRSVIVAQIALCLVLLTAAGLFLRSLNNVLNVQMGFDQEHVFLFRVDESAVGYREDARLENLYRQIEERVSSVPGVRAASFSFFTFNQGGWRDHISTPATASLGMNERVVSHNVVGPGYFATMGIPFLMGRLFNAQDMLNSPKVAIINETLAKRFFPNESPLGKQFHLGGPESGADGNREVIGIVKDAKYQSLREPAEPAAFYPHSQRIQYLSDFEVRYTGEPSGVVAAVRREIAAIDPHLPISDVTTLAEQVKRSVVDQRLIAQLSSFFGLLAVSLACIGIYGLVSYGVSQRTNEIGIRMALGATAGGVLWLVLWEVLVLVLIGVTLGVPLLLGAQGFIASQLYGLRPADPSCLAFAALIMLCVAALSGYLPARRAAKIHPMVALRYE